MGAVVAQMVIRPRIDLRPGAIVRGLIDERGAIDRRRAFAPYRLFVIDSGARFVDDARVSAAACRIQMRQRGLL